MILVLFQTLHSTADAQDPFERPPIAYSKTKPTDRVQQLADKALKGGVQFNWEPKQGYLQSILTELDIPISSQTLVFSKTSLQVRHISPTTPRAIYFNDDVYVGWIPGADTIEISAADSLLGATFYSLEQRHLKDSPPIVRQTDQCLQCHGGSFTRNSPGHLVRSVFSDRNGQPVFRLGTKMSDTASSFNERFGGWYVTGTHGKMRHMGNCWVKDARTSTDLDRESGANKTELTQFADLDRYPTHHSDIVALMVLHHQVHLHNVLTQANHAGRFTELDAKTMNRILERDPDYVSDSTQSRYQNAAEKVVKAILFCDEPKFSSTIKGTSDFANHFSSRAINGDNRLFQFDLENRLFKYRCSYLIYSNAFKELSPNVKSIVLQRLQEILTDQDKSEPFAHIPRAERSLIHKILGLTLVPYAELNLESKRQSE